MAAAATLEENVTCSICFEIYRDPQALPCLHTYCLECVNNIKQGTRVRCPECREVADITHIKNDFKIRGFVDLYNLQCKEECDRGRKSAIKRQTSVRTKAVLVQPSEKVAAKCGMCKYANNKIMSKCIDCNQFMCEGCEFVHGGVQVCQDHQVLSVANVVRDIQHSVQKSIGTLQTEHSELGKRVQEVDKKIKDLKQVKEEQIAQVNSITDDLIKELNNNRDHIVGAVTSANDNLVNDLQSGKESFENGQKELQENVEFLTNLVSNIDISTVETATIAQDAIKADVLNLKDSLPYINLNVNSPVHVQKGRKPNVQSIVSIKFGSESHTQPERQTQLDQLQSSSHPRSSRSPSSFSTSLQIQSNATPVDENYQKLTINNYKYERSAKVSFFPQRIRIIDNRLWVAGWDGVYLFSKNCTLLKTVQHQYLKKVRSLVQCHTKEILVACDSSEGGIVALDSSTIRYRGKIINGSFTDICACGNYVYALDRDLGNIVVLQCHFGQWTQLKLLTNILNCNRLDVNCDTLYISSREHDKISVYNLDGQLMYLIGESGTRKPGDLCRPLLADVNNAGDVLISDCDNHRLQVRLKQGGKWFVLKLPGNLQWPVDACVDSDEATMLYVISHEPSQLLKFTATRSMNSLASSASLAQQDMGSVV